MDPIIINQIVPIIVGALIVLAGRYTDAGRKNAKELKELRAWKSAGVVYYYQCKTAVAKHNFANADVEGAEALVLPKVPEELKEDIEDD